MHAIIHTYRSLLADVAKSSGFSEIRGSLVDLQWCLNEAPKLEKHILRHLETGESLNLKLFPYELRRLAAASVVDPASMRAIRQLLLFCYKAYVQHDKRTEDEVLANFFTTNNETKDYGDSLYSASPILLHLVTKHVQSVLYRVRPRDIVPSHGPGASLTPKGVWTRWYSSIEYLYPYSDYMAMYYNIDHCAEFGDATDDHIKARITAVPKDSRGPRLICVHPAEAIWIQQGLRRALEKAIQSPRGEGIWPRGHIHFDDQSVNGRIALLSSRSRKYATLDLKEASDRLSEQLVQRLFGRYYKWFACCRAQKYISPKGAKAPADDNIYCYAPMGNATTFPVQSLVFWAISCASLQVAGCKQPNACFVFGDDILVPTAYAHVVIRDLESFGLKVNRDKTFINSHFRESCGVDAFNGFNVTPVRWKCSVDAEHRSELLSLSDLAMRLRIAGYAEASATAYGILRKRLRSHGKKLFLTNNPNHGSIAEYVELDSLVFADAYWHRHLHKFVSPCHKLKELPQKRSACGWNHVLESVTSLIRSSHSNVPERTVSRRSVLERGWTDVL